jgi:hypothetical protein
MPMAWRGCLRPLTGPELLAAIAMLALLAGVTLALAASEFCLAGAIPLWDAALVLCALAVLTSLLRFPEWWTWNGGWGTHARTCSGARKRRASHTVMPCQTRTRQRPDRPGAHRGVAHATSAPLAGTTHRLRTEWLLTARRRDSMPRLQRQHGRLRG